MCPQACSMNHEAFEEMVSRASSPVLWWMGQMGFLMKLGGTLVSIDYYALPAAGRQVPPPVPAEELRGVSLFFGTHNHSDHMDIPSWKIWLKTCPDARFVFPRAHTDFLLREGFPADRLIGMNDGETVQAGSLTIHALAAAHEFLDRDPATGLYPCLQYVLEGGGKRIYHAGDTLRYEGMLPALQALGHFDAAILPINGRDATRYRANCIGNMTFQESADLAGELRPGLVIPGHWDMFAANSADPHAFADYLDAKYGDLVPCRIPEYLSPILPG